MIVEPNDLTRVSNATRKFLDRPHGHFIGGMWIEGNGSLPVFDPSSGEQIACASAAGIYEVDQAVQAASAALKNSLWKNMPALDREKLIYTLASLLEENIELLSQLETLDNGMPEWFAKLNVGGAASVLRYMAGWASKITGNTIDVKMPFPSQFVGYTTKEPVGVVAAIVPWNVPLMMAVWKLAPALAAGCTVVLKPAEDTPLSSLLLAELSAQAGFPPGVINIVTGLGREAGEALVTHPLVNKVTFTGSTATGKHIGHLATDGLKKVTLELGGKSPTIIFDDANIEIAVAGAANAIFLNSGQICVAGARLYVQRRIYAEVADRIASHADKIIVGAGFNSDTQMGPLINARQQERVNRYVDEAQSRGGSLLTTRKFENSNGYFVAPSVVVGLEQQDPLVREEVFGPVLAVLPFDDDEQAVELANDSEYGLAACIFSQSVDRIHKLIPKLKCGKVSVNHSGFPYPALPEGGTKQSGYGRDLGREGLEGYLETKSVLMQIHD